MLVINIQELLSTLHLKMHLSSIYIFQPVDMTITNVFYQVDEVFTMTHNNKNENTLFVFLNEIFITECRNIVLLKHKQAPLYSSITKQEYLLQLW